MRIASLSTLAGSIIFLTFGAAPQAAEPPPSAPDGGAAVAAAQPAPRPSRGGGASQISATSGPIVSRSTRAP